MATEDPKKPKQPPTIEEKRRHAEHANTVLKALRFENHGKPAYFDNNRYQITARWPHGKTDIHYSGELSYRERSTDLLKAGAAITIEKQWWSYHNETINLADILPASPQNPEKKDRRAQAPAQSLLPNRR